MRGLAPASVFIGLVLTSLPAHSQEDLQSFLNDVHPREARWALECFQAGRRVITEKDLRIQKTPIGREHRGAIRLATTDGRIINVDRSPDLACIIRQQGETPVTAAALSPSSLSQGGMQNFLLAEKRTPGPDVAWSDATGKPVSLEDFRGKVVLVNFWASWCVPCLRGLPSLNRLQQELGGDQFEVVAINTDQQGKRVAEPFAKRLRLDALDLYLDPRGRVSRGVGVQVMPTTVLYGRNGLEIGRIEGPAEWYTADATNLILSFIEAREN